MIRSKKDLEVVLSRLSSFEKPSFFLEQYATPSAIAADWIWGMALKGEIAGKKIVDLACGPGILGLGLLLMGAKSIIFVDKDPKIMAICQANYQQLGQEYEIGEAEFLVQDISLVAHEDSDIAVQNPPFGTKNEHIDKRFLEKAFSSAPIVYSMHKWTTKAFVEAISRDHHFTITDVWRYEFPIKAVFEFHKKPVRMVDVGLWRMEKEV